MNSKSTKAFSLFEVLIASTVFTIALLPILWSVNNYNRSAMDAYYEFLALTLAKEPVEVFRALGYDWLVANSTNPHPDFPSGEKQISADGEKYPVEAGAFKRKIDLKVMPEQKSILVTVTVYPAAQTRVRAWLSGTEIVHKGLVVRKK
ncbi:MAG: hypothetical protein HQM10_10625 [Candidatus Riflebacteria bacterium]|nr:hypothetical protein [Candidatus Riflebacteria bacterium]